MDHELSVASNGSGAGPIIGVFPANTSVLLMDADDIFHMPGFPFVGVEHSIQIVDGAEAIATKLEIVGHHTRSDVAQVKGGLPVEGVPRVSIGDDHIRQGHAIEDTSPVVSNLVM